MQTAAAGHTTRGGGAMNDVTASLRRNIAQRRRTDIAFRWCAGGAMLVGMLFLLWLLATNFYGAANALFQTHIALDIPLQIDGDAPERENSAAQKTATETTTVTTTEAIANAPYGKMIKTALREHFPAVTQRREKRQLYQLVSSGAEYALRDAVLENPQWVGQTRRFWLLADSDVDLWLKSGGATAAVESRLSAPAVGWARRLVAEERLAKRFNKPFFTAGDSRNAEQAGILGALVGSCLTLIATMLLAVPVGIAAAVYLQEFAPKNRLVDWVEININNLAAVPSITFGLLGLAVLINFFGLPRSIPLVGGIVLALMTLPTIIISSRAALAAVPPRIRQAALGVGASEVQTVLHHVLPQAMPGMLTGAIIGLAQALGETAPLLIIGMVAFIVDIPTGLETPSTALPVQIYLWADSPERGFAERTAAAILVLLCILAVVNGCVAYLRNKFAKRW